MTPTESSRLRFLPSTDKLLRSPEANSLLEVHGPDRLGVAARMVIEELRQELLQDGSSIKTTLGDLKEELLRNAIERLENVCRLESERTIRPVINATGVILHTNLGRAPLSEKALAAISSAAGYCTLEYDIVNGTRGRRGANVERLLTQLTGAEDALVVNNCAAAALLILKVLGDGGETIVSRGELVEIGGDFRVPDVMANSGTQMIEVGSTNRTRLQDYQNAIGANTRLIMRVHPSNYRIVGFTSTPTILELSECAHTANLILYEDAGSGNLLDLRDYGLEDEPIIRESLAQGADVVSFSGDKLLGSAQAGLIVGRSEIISRLRKHSLYRALRADKLCLAALEATLEAHLTGHSLTEVPTLKMLTTSRQEIEQRAVNLLRQLDQAGAGSNDPKRLKATLIPGESAIGGGCGPDLKPETVLIALEHEQFSANAIEERLRKNHIPVIARVANDKVLLDLRTVPATSEPALLSALIDLH